MRSLLELTTRAVNDDLFSIKEIRIGLLVVSKWPWTEATHHGSVTVDLARYDLNWRRNKIVHDDVIEVSPLYLCLLHVRS